MSIGRFSVLGMMALAATTEEDPLGDIGIDSDIDHSDFTTALRAAVKTERADRLMQLGEILLNLSRRTSKSKHYYRQSIRSARKQERVFKNKLDQLDRAWAYARATENFVPVAYLLGFGASDLSLNYDDFQRLVRIPDDWQPPTTEENTSTEDEGSEPVRPSDD